MSSSPDAWRAYQAAKKVLHDNQAAEIEAGIDDETPEYLALNTRVNELAKEVPWWKR